MTELLRSFTPSFTRHSHAAFVTSRLSVVSPRVGVQRIVARATLIQIAERRADTIDRLGLCAAAAIRSGSGQCLVEAADVGEIGLQRSARRLSEDPGSGAALGVGGRSAGSALLEARG